MQKITTFIFLVLCYCLFANHLSAQNSGTDYYGYKWRTSKDIGAPAPKWVDITTRVGKGAINITDRFNDDTNFGPINFSFDMPYYWYTRNYLYIGSNGYISFQDNQIASPFATFPAAGGNSDDFMGILLSDLTLAGDQNPGQVWFYTDFKDTVIVSWINVPFFSPGTNFVGANTFQVILSRTDSSITYNYQLQTGQSPGDGTIVVGFENVNGKVGCNVPTDFLTGVTPNTPVAVKFKAPASSKYSIGDLAVLWNTDPSNGGRFLSKGGVSPSLHTFIDNVGLQTIASTPVAAKIYKGNTVVSQSSLASGDLQPGDAIYFDTKLKLPMNKAELYRFETKVSSSLDKASQNNIISQFFQVVDTTESEIDLQYGQGGGSLVDWLGATNGNAGMGVYIKPPFYPVAVSTILAELGGEGAGVRAIIQNDNGKNLFGQYNGSPGDTLFAKDFLGVTSGQNELVLDSNLQINSGGIYIAILQLGPNFGVTMTSSAPFSYRSYEVFNGKYSSSRFKKSSEPNIGIRIVQGDKSIAPDIGIARIISPVHEQDIADSVQVKAVIKNFKNIKIDESFPIIYKAFGRNEVREICNTVLNPGDSLIFTFNKWLVAPPKPKTYYDYVCVRTDLDNDINLNNNSNCIGNYVPEGIQAHNVSNINGLSVFPNPAKDQLSLMYELSAKTALSFELYDQIGRCVSKTDWVGLQAGIENKTINISDISAGIYFYCLRSAVSVVKGKIAIKN